MSERLVIVSNRLPVNVSKRKRNIGVTPSVGGLATGMKSFYKSYESLWIGWSGIDTRKYTAHEKEQIVKKMGDENCLPIFLSQNDVNKYYYGFSNKTLWPLFHYFPQFTRYRDELWKAYKKVNQHFADVVNENYQEGDIIWIHDYHLLLLPKMIREKHPEATIGFFLHIPFPSYEIFRLLPWREELAEGMLGSDLIGFHTYDYERHFLSSVRRMLGYENIYNHVTVGKRTVLIDAFPMGIDYEKFYNESKSKDNQNGTGQTKIQKEIEHYYARGEERKIILSVDRLDYSKGIPNRLKAYEYFLEAHPEYHEKVMMILVAVPSRENVKEYKELKIELDGLVSKINSHYGNIHWMPIWYLYQKFPFEKLVELYKASDIGLVTPIRDGMNLIAKEFIASKTDGKGVLILSEMAGATKEMGEALIVNPNNRIEIAESMVEAINLPEQEQIHKNQQMQRRLKKYNVIRWAQDFMDSLTNIKQLQDERLKKQLDKKAEKTIIEDFKKSSNKLLFMDVDGTLMEKRSRWATEKPDKELLKLLKKISTHESNRLILVSGRNGKVLEKWFEDIPATLVAEHGAWIKRNLEEWHLTDAYDDEWKENVRPLLQFYEDRTPGSFIDEKSFSLIWDYNRCDPDEGRTRAWELIDQLRDLTANLNLEILEGKRLIEVKTAGINKGRVATEFIGEKDWDFILGVGDDWTDEYLFEVLPEKAYSIRVGFYNTRACYNVSDVKEIRSLIKLFSSV
ncbi:MAG: bifunctional alpha,alpha-trehalose-phosphate synthase (UDP-forming)/trehalose-phosphatase [Bacteroidales bacterium]|nr:bifunctional alpha,alpha-trehalose-phosphate synthase (UDP-forming)/trehalose-phosphatase [Bacteroidales bacterium]